jgi:hypothetical protein
MGIDLRRIVVVSAEIASRSPLPALSTVKFLPIPASTSNNKYVE